MEGSTDSGGVTAGAGLPPRAVVLALRSMTALHLAKFRLACEPKNHRRTGSWAFDTDRTLPVSRPAQSP